MTSRAPWLLACLVTIAPAAEIHVSPSAAANGDGSASAPFATLGAARDAARKYAGKETVTIHVADGICYLPETLVLTPQDSGSEKHPVIYQAENEGKAVISGGVKLDLKWEAGPNGVWRAATPAGLHIDQLFINGARQHMARYPDFDPAKTTDAYQGFAADAFSKERAARWADPAGGFIHAMHASRWGDYHYLITGKNPDGTVKYEGGWQNNRQMGMHPQFRMVENIFEELDAPGEWFHDAKTNTLHFMPAPGTDMASARVEAVRLARLVDLQGSSGNAVKHIVFKGFVFRHAARTFMENKEPLLRSDWTICRSGAITLTGTESVSILDCELDQPGGNAIFINNYNRKTLVKGCHIHDTGTSGVCFVGDPKAVRDPLFEYNQKQDLSKIDRTPGPKTDNYPADCSVEDSLIHGIGRVERQPAGVQISMSYRISVKDCSIYDCARSGININEGTWGGHLIEGCDVFETVLETHDHGSFNSWGRDRYWTSNHRAISGPAVKKEPQLPFLDVIQPIVIRHNRWRCDHGWDIDLDDGSSNYIIENNLLLVGGLKFREGYRRKAENNILVNNGFHPHVWFDDSDSSFRHNIVMRAHAPAGPPEGWGKQVDENCFSSEADRKKYLSAGADARSVSGDPMFVDPANGDYRVKPGSPALKIGFKNFPMDHFGVKKPALRAIARTPMFPEPALSHGGGQTAERPAAWFGASLRGITGEEFSAFGTRKEDGGVQVLEVPANSPAAKAGLQGNDLIQSLNGGKIVETGDFLSALAKAGDAPLVIGIVRTQKPQTVTVQGMPFVQTEESANGTDWKKLPLPAKPAGSVQAGGKTSDEPVSTLVDGQIAKNYGPVYVNGVRDGSYRLDLGSVRDVSAIAAWTCNPTPGRSHQFWTAYGSNSSTDPGWNISDRSLYTPIATVDTRKLPIADFRAVSLRSRPGATLGKFRWIVWRISPITTGDQENSAFQEISAW